MPPLRTKQDDWSAGFSGMGARKTPPNAGVYLDECLIDDLGKPYARGGSVAKSAADFGSSDLTFLWAGWLAGGKRIVTANSADFAAYDEGPLTPRNLGGSGLSKPVRPVVFNNALYINRGDGTGMIYGGSTEPTHNYSTGTVTVTNGSATVTGAGGADFSATVEAGDLFKATGNIPFPIKSVDSSTQLTLAVPWPGTTAAGIGYSVKGVEFSDIPFGGTSGVIYATVANRLIVCIGNRVYLSGIGDPGDFDLANGGRFHELPGGVKIVGAVGIRDTLMVFTTDGMWAISNMAYDLTDADGNVQHRVEFVNSEIVLLGNGAGVVNWQNNLIVPASDGIWLVDTVSTPRQITGPMQDYYRANLVELGYTPGNAVVFRGHYWLPMLDTNFDGVLTLVCRLSPTERGVAFGWTRNIWFATSHAVYDSVAADLGTPDDAKLLSVGPGNYRVRQEEPFDPVSALTDYHTSAAPPVLCVSAPAEFDKEVTFKSVRARYVLTSNASDKSMNVSVRLEDGRTVNLADFPQADLEDDPYLARLGKQARGVYLQVSSEGDQIYSFKLESVEFFVRENSKQ